MVGDDDRQRTHPLQYDPEEHVMDDRSTAILRRYARGAISAGPAAGELGPSYDVSDG
jgi:hypothetical protein